jgi:hypothetical protein
MAKHAQTQGGTSAAGNAVANPPGSAPAKGEKMTKTKAVRAALSEGVTSPSEIAAFLKDRYNMKISPAHVSNIKSKSKPGGNGRRRGKKKLGRPRKVVPAQGTTPPAPAAPSPSERRAPAAVGLTANELDMLLQIAKRMGGFTELGDYLDVLGRYQR